MVDLNKYRNKDGFIEIDSSLVEMTFNETEGDAKKLWLSLGYERLTLFKEALFVERPRITILYQLYSALFSSEIANMIGIPCAQYDLAIYDGKIGIISPDFKKFGEVITSGASIINNVLSYNRVTFYNRLKDIRGLFGCYFNDEIKAQELYEEFAINYYMLDFVLVMYDRHQKNWGIINNGNKSDSRLTPRYDTELIAEIYLGKPRVERLIGLYDPQTGSKINGMDLWSDDLEAKFYNKIGQKNNVDMEFFCNENYELAKKGYEIISKIDVKKAFENIESKIGTELPGEYKRWLTIVVNYRIDFIRKTLERIVQNEKHSVELENELHGSAKR